MRRKSRLFVLGFILLAGAWSSAISGPPEKLRVSTWYWLNSIERTEWEQDFKTMAETGFTHVVLCWGLDAAAVLPQKENTRLALDLCQRYGLKAYLLIWHPSYNKLPRNPSFQQVDNLGNVLFTFNLFHRKWRATQWKNYLQGVAATYKDHPALAGYLFDDTFYVGLIGSPIADPKKIRGDFVSYSDYDREQFRIWLKKKYSTIAALNSAWKTSYANWTPVEAPRKITVDNGTAWKDWCEARLLWLNEWAGDTVKFIRATDPLTEHEIVLEDGEYILGKERKSPQSARAITMTDSIGLKFGEIAGPFDAVCGYTTFSWVRTNALALATNRTTQFLKELHGVAPKGKKIIYAFWVTDSSLTSPASILPDAAQIGAITRTALENGIRQVDFYGYRIGDWRVTAQEWEAYDSKAREYPIAPSIKGRFLCDRPEVRERLKIEIKI